MPGTMKGKLLFSCIGAELYRTCLTFCKHGTHTCALYVGNSGEAQPF